jgi:hypothetical protein
MADLVSFTLVLSRDGRGPMRVRLESGALLNRQKPGRIDRVAEWVGPDPETGRVTAFDCSVRRRDPGGVKMRAERVARAGAADRKHEL